MSTSATGVQFPLDPSGSRSTSRLAKDVVADALVTATRQPNGSSHQDWRKVTSNRSPNSFPWASTTPATGTAWRRSLDSLQSRMVGARQRRRPSRPR